jgi:hypothetical protein
MTAQIHSYGGKVFGQFNRCCMHPAKCRDHIVM